MMKRKGLSEVVSTVLMVLITIAAVAFVANLAIPFVKNNLQHSTECLSARDYFKFDDSLGYNCYDQTGLYGFSVQAGNGGETSATEQLNDQYHSADYNGNWTIDVVERDRFLVLYNYRINNVRTGEYHCDSTTIDGYAPGPGSQNCPTHSGDYNGNWRIDNANPNLELGRLISLSNTQGGQYHPVVVDSTNPDGYDSGASTQSGSAASVGNNITGFAVVFDSSSDSTTTKIIDGVNADIPNTAVGNSRMLDKRIAKIYVSRPGEVQTYVYNAGSAKYSQVEIYPILQSGRLCDKSDSITVSLCKGVSLTP